MNELHQQVCDYLSGADPADADPKKLAEFLREQGHPSMTGWGAKAILQAIAECGGCPTRFNEVHAELFGMPAREFAEGGKKEAGHWITVGAQVGEDGKKHGGTKVFVRDGRIVKGHPSLTGRRIDALKQDGEPEEEPTPEHSPRQAVAHEKKQHRAELARQAREEGIDPGELHQLAGEIIAHDKEGKADLDKMISEVHRAYPQTRTIAARNARGIDKDAVRGLDDIAASMAGRSEFAHLFAGHQGDEEQRLFDILLSGKPEHISHEQALEEALEHLRERKREEDWVPFHDVSNQPRDEEGKWTRGGGKGHAHGSKEHVQEVVNRHLAGGGEVSHPAVARALNQAGYANVTPETLPHVLGYAGVRLPQAGGEVPLADVARHVERFAQRNHGLVNLADLREAVGSPDVPSFHQAIQALRRAGAVSGVAWEGRYGPPSARDQESMIRENVGESLPQQITAIEVADPKKLAKAIAGNHFAEDDGDPFDIDMRGCRKKTCAQRAIERLSGVRVPARERNLYQIIMEAEDLGLEREVVGGWRGKRPAEFLDSAMAKGRSFMVFGLGREEVPGEHGHVATVLDGVPERFEDFGDRTIHTVVEFTKYDGFSERRSDVAIRRFLQKAGYPQPEQQRRRRRRARRGGGRVDREHIVVNVPAPVVQVNMPELPAPVIHFTAPERPAGVTKHVDLKHDRDGKLVGAEITEG
jgi:hypothetical protein